MQERPNPIEKISIEFADHPIKTSMLMASLAFMTVGLLELPIQPQKAIVVFGVGLILLGIYKLSKQQERKNK